MITGQMRYVVLMFAIKLEECESCDNVTFVFGIDLCIVKLFNNFDDIQLDM